MHSPIAPVIQLTTASHCLYSLRIVPKDDVCEARPADGTTCRQMTNEAEVFSMLQAVQGVQARLVDFAQLSLADQIQLIAAETDILVGMLPDMPPQQQGGIGIKRGQRREWRPAGGEGKGGGGCRPPMLPSPFARYHTSHHCEGWPLGEIQFGPYVPSTGLNTLSLSLLFITGDLHDLLMVEL